MLDNALIHLFPCNILFHLCFVFIGCISSISFNLTEPPEILSNIKPQSVDKGDTLKVKVPFSGTGPFDFKLKKNGREVPDSGRVKITPFDDYVVMQIKGESAVVIWLLPGQHHTHN